MRRLIRRAYSWGGVLLLAQRGDIIPLATGFLVPMPTTARTSPLPPWSHALSLVPSVSGAESRSGQCRQGTRKASCARGRPSYSSVCSKSQKQVGTKPMTCCAAAVGDTSSPPGSADNRLQGADAAGSATSSVVITVTEEPRGKGDKEVAGQEAGGMSGSSSISSSSSSSSSSSTWSSQGLNPIAGASSTPSAADLLSDTTAEGGLLVNGFELETGAPWTEFEDWLLQDTFSRYAIGSGKHVLWRRMVREVPELMERAPQEARQRWLRLTGRLGSGGGVGYGGGEKAPGSPSLDDFYLQPPVLEQWEEIVDGEGMGSFRGHVFGQKGLADGTMVTTAPVDVSGRRIQDQYVSTQCGVVYELGGGRQKDLVGQASSKILKLAPVAALALSGAVYAFTVLSHHIQVEVFVI